MWFCSLDICPYLFVHADGFSLRRATRKIRMYARHGAQNLPYLLAGRQLERRTRSDRLFRAVSPRRFATRVQLGGSKFPVLFLQPSIRIQLSSFRNNCYRFPTAMLHFQLFTSKRSPLFRRDLPPLSLSLSLSLPLSSFPFLARARSRLFSLSPSVLSSPSFPPRFCSIVPRPLRVHPASLRSSPLSVAPCWPRSAFPFHREPSFSSREQHLLFTSVLLSSSSSSFFLPLCRAPLRSPLSLFASSFNLQPLFDLVLLSHTHMPFLRHSASFFHARALVALAPTALATVFVTVSRVRVTDTRACVQTRTRS